MLLRIVCTLLLAGLFAGCGAAPANTPEPNSLYLENAWARLSPLPNGNSAVYLTVINPLDKADRLLDASSPLGITSLHESVTKGDIVSMEARPDGFEIPPDGRLELAPGGKHIMIMGIAEPLAVGDTVQVTLNLELYGAIIITAPVQLEPKM